MSFIFNYGVPLVLNACAASVGDWLIHKGTSMINEGTKQASDLLNHVCHGCTINRFAPSTDAVIRLIDQSTLYTEKAARELKETFIEAIHKESVLGPGILNMGRICHVANAALTIYLACKVASRMRALFQRD